MRLGRFALILACGLWPTWGAAQDGHGVASMMARLCLLGGHIETVSVVAAGPPQLVLRSVDAGGHVQSQFSIDQPSAKAVYNGIDSALAGLPAAQAASVRACLQPARAALLELMNRPPILTGKLRSVPTLPEVSAQGRLAQAAPTPPNGPHSAPPRSATSALARPPADAAAPPKPDTPVSAQPPAGGAPVVLQQAEPPDELARIRAEGEQLKQLPVGKIYLNAPIEMKVGDQRLVDARVGMGVPDEVLKGHPRPGDQSTPGSLPVSHQMVAKLNGPAFAINALTPEKQIVAEGFVTVWQWQIKAKQDGAQELEATLYALLPDIGRDAAQRYIDSYSRTIQVDVKPMTLSEWLHWIYEQLAQMQGIAITVGGLVTAAAGWLGVVLARREPHGRGRPRKPKHPAASPTSTAT